jgi:tetratricopeptide (TPR) repeat protein
MTQIVLSFLLAAACVFPAGAADTSPSSTPADSGLTRARELVSRKDWAAATPALAAYVQANPGSADGHNLLGYSLRHQKKYDESLAAYQQALKLDPRHKGAHEYIGIAYVEMKQLDKAREHLAALDKICRFSCEEYRDLKKAIEAAAR